jgi:hypothetical protein
MGILVRLNCETCLNHRDVEIIAPVPLSGLYQHVAERAQAVGWRVDGDQATCARCVDLEKQYVTKESRGVAGDRCESGNNCGRVGCPECQQ